ncbi:nitrate transporter CrnA [Xylona heveae TC161]|uniref:Nitrate/nitrite transporter n=1 Tax=Xylona heveae (strain CBS 132557 / TC161) TaxID=1328760 RepID=A0A161TQ11_XYLHT|nr:nitrate transporter CrnA [Xylona heveae TC161]KZF24376.1 nitrate transporter CrnA [Xylona heveae TC161]
MGVDLAIIFKAPRVNPINRKAQTIPALNPINTYGRVFFFSWFGFMIAFWSWYAFPPLMTLTISKDLKLSQADVSNSNIIALAATLIVRLVAGPACDRWGPRYTFAGCLLAGAVPTVLAGCVFNAKGLLALRFFIGILGGSFVPCQVWSTGFFDKNIVGTANALTGGLGNAGGGITYFVMPAIFESLVKNQHLSPHTAWRVAFVVPFILITATAIALVLLCPDTPTGKWSERHLAAEQNLEAHQVDRHEVEGQVVDIPEHQAGERKESQPDSITPPAIDMDEKANTEGKAYADREAQLGEQQMLDTAKGEVISKPTFREALPVIFSLPTLTLAGCYFCTFGAELSINSILGAYYLHKFPRLGQSESGNWAAMFGLLNVVCRPIGGFFSDFAYRRSKNLWVKKILVHSYSIINGAFLLAIGLTNPSKEATMFGLFAGMAFFLEGANGANFSLVPHVHPFANGIVSGLTGAAGNLGGIIFAIIFRYNGKDYARSIWIIGVITLAINVSLSWIRPIPRSQIGGTL